MTFGRLGAVDAAAKMSGMEGALPAVRTYRLPLNWRWLGIAAMIAVNTVLLVIVIAAFFMSDVGADWMVYREAGARVASGTVYQSEWYYIFRYSPLVAYLFAVIGPWGFLPWAAAHFAALLALPRRIALIALLSFPFWEDVYNGNTMTFVAVAGFLVLRGSRWGTAAFVVMAVLMPRPLMIPLLAWLVWQRPAWRLPKFGSGGGALLASLATGMGVTWLLSLRQTGQEFGSIIDIGPSLVLGAWWIPLGIVVAVVLTWKGWLGLASLAASPYWLPYYPAMLLLELADRVGSNRIVQR
jgi:hypothetical protein